jgi:hypothetical protein
MHGKTLPLTMLRMTQVGKEEEIPGGQRAVHPGGLDAAAKPL